MLYFCTPNLCYDKLILTLRLTGSLITTNYQSCMACSHLLKAGELMLFFFNFRSDF